MGQLPSNISSSHPNTYSQNIYSQNIYSQNNIHAPALPLAILPDQPLTALAPMQDITDQPFMQLISEFGSPDYYFTEYFRVHSSSHLEKHILRAITDHQTNRPIFAQLIGESIPDLLRTVELLRPYPIAGIDLNLGCPAPRVYRKNVGGGLLRDLSTLNQILGSLRQHITGLFTVKMRLGFDSTDHFPALLELLQTHQIDLLSLHGRTVKELYRGPVHYAYIRQAVTYLDCPVFANGNITSADRAMEVLTETQAAGVMVGRAAIRNPWIFQQIRQKLTGQPLSEINLGQVYDYITQLYQRTYPVNKPPMTLPEPTVNLATVRGHIQRMKKYLNFIAQSVDPAGAFLYDIRRTQTPEDFWEVCQRHLLTEPETPFALEPYPDVIARPSCEDMVT